LKEAERNVEVKKDEVVAKKHLRARINPLQALLLMGRVLESDSASLLLLSRMRLKLERGFESQDFVVVNFVLRLEGTGEPGSLKCLGPNSEFDGCRRQRLKGQILCLHF
jgi:hypothetical protein